MSSAFSRMRMGGNVMTALGLFAVLTGAVAADGLYNVLNLAAGNRETPL